MKFPKVVCKTPLQTGLKHGMRNLRQALYFCWQIIVGLILVAALQACSVVKVAYNQAPGLALRYIDSHLDLNSAQSLQVKTELITLQAWHRRTQLPSYIAMLQKLQQQVLADISTQDMCTLVQDVREQLITLANHTEPAVLALTLTLQPQQLQHLETYWAEKNTEYRKEFLQGSPAQKYEQRLRQAVERAEMLYRKLEPQQVLLLGKQLNASAFDPALSLADRLWRQQDALQTLRNLSAKTSTLDNAHTAMRALFERALNPPQANHRQYIMQLSQEGCRNLAELHNSTSAAQRTQAAQTLRGYAEDLRILAAQQR